VNKSNVSSHVRSSIGEIFSLSSVEVKGTPLLREVEEEEEEEGTGMLKRASDFSIDVVDSFLFERKSVEMVISELI
jgi:hypothetical protein